MYTEGLWGLLQGWPEDCSGPNLEMLWYAAGSAIIDGMSRFADVDAVLWLLWRSSSTATSACELSRALSTSSVEMFFPCGMPAGMITVQR